MRLRGFSGIHALYNFPKRKPIGWTNASAKAIVHGREGQNPGIKFLTTKTFSFYADSEDVNRAFLNDLEIQDFIGNANRSIEVAADSNGDKRSKQ